MRSRSRAHVRHVLARAGLIAGLAACLWSPGGAWAQFDQYKAPGPGERPRDRKQVLEEAIEEARWRLGAVRVSPWIGVSDVQYVDDVYAGVSLEDRSDVTATVGAGLRAYLRTGPKVIWAAHAIPEYVDWRELSDRRHAGGRYGLGAFGFFNRLTFQALAERTDSQGLATPELPQTVQLRADHAALDAEVAVGGALSLFGGGEGFHTRTLLDRAAEPLLAPVDRLDRDQTIARGGVRWRLPHGWSVGAGVERTAVDFLTTDPEFDLSNDGTSPVVEVRHDAERFFLLLEAADRSLEPRPGSSFVPFDEITGSFQASFGTAGRLVPTVYGSRNLVYALTPGYSYLVDDRVGAALDVGFGWRTRLRPFAEVGTNEYTRRAADGPGRRDDTLAYGATVSFGLGRRGLGISLRARRTEFDADVEALDRSITSLGIGVSLGGLRSAW